MDSPPSSPLTSPLATFFYVLMRDYLPTGTVKMLVERSKLAGDPTYSAPELEQLAARYAGELLDAPPRNGNTDDVEPDHHESPADPPASDSSAPIEDPEYPSDSDGKPEPPPEPRAPALPPRPAPGPALDKIRAVIPTDNWVNVPWIMEATSLKKSAVRRHVQRLVKSGEAEAKGNTQARLYRTCRVPVPPPVPDPNRPPPKTDRPNNGPGTGDGKASGKTVALYRDFIRERGRCKPADLESLGFSSATRARVIRALRDAGEVDVEYDGIQRIVIWAGDGEHKSEQISEQNSGQTSEPDHDDSGEGDVPADPEGDTEGGEGASSSSAEGRMDESDSTESTQQPPRDDVGEESGSPSVAPTTADPEPPSPPIKPVLPPRRPPRSRRAPAREDDIELMAKVSDHLKKADGLVWPAELEDTYGISGETRRRIIGKLVERSRIWVLGAGPKRCYAYRGGVDDRQKPTFDGASEDEGLGESDGNYTDHSAARAEAAKVERANDVVEVHENLPLVREWAPGVGQFNVRQVVDTFEVSAIAATQIVAKLVGEGFLVSHEEPKAGVSYHVKRGKPTNGDGPAGKRPLSAGADGATLEGRALSALGTTPMTVDEVAQRIGVSHEVGIKVIGKLFREGEIRPKRKGGRLLYGVTI